MSATVSTGQVAGFDAVTLDNGLLRAVVLPSLGGRVWELHDLARGRQWIWHRPDVRLKVSHGGDDYDEVWAGGWEELFPNDARGPFEGRDLPDHGEWWTLPWSVVDRSSGTEARLVLTARSTAIRATCTKEFVLAAGTSSLAVHYTIESEEPDAFHFLFKQHLPIALTPACRLVLPGGQMQAVDPTFGTILPGPGPFPWPVAPSPAGDPVDLRAVPEPAVKAREFVYVRDLPAGWCGVIDLAKDASLRLAFDQQVMPFVWLFLSYGGWRDVYTAVLEPCSNMPKDLTEAVRLGQSAQLAPGGVFRTSVTVTVSGLDGVTE